MKRAILLACALAGCGLPDLTPRDRVVEERLPSPPVLLTELMVDAVTPEAGGEYAEVLNLGPGPLDLAGWRFEKRTVAGDWAGCTVGDGEAARWPRATWR